jgi:hypothetical protein
VDTLNITLPTNLPSGDRRSIRVVPAPVPIALVLVDRDGDVWRQVGVTLEGEPRMVCDRPQAPDEAAPGESNPWTPSAIAAWFSPVRTLGGTA